jgi:hypothetical protein
MDAVFEPFPSDIDRDAFGHWLSGFVDGEGCFQLRYSRVVSGNRKDVYKAPSAGFYIKLRADDTTTLLLIQRYWQAGTLKRQANGSSRSPNPSSCLAIHRIGILAGVLVPHFERYPLRSKKSRDFAIWKQAVAIWDEVAKRENQFRPRRRGDFQGRYARWQPADTERFLALYDQLRSTRGYDPSIDTGL